MLITENKLHKLIFILILVTIFVIPLLYLPYPGSMELVQTDFSEYKLLRNDNIYLPRVRFLYLIAVSILIVTYFLVKKNGQLFKKNKINIIALFLFFQLIISTLFSEYKFIALYGRPFRWEGFITFSIYLLLFFITANLIRNKAEIKLIFKVFFLTGSLVSIYGLLQFFGIDFIARDPVRVNWVRRSFATFGNPNFAGSFTALILPPAVVFYLLSKEKKNTIILYCLSAIFFAFTLATSTRGVWLGLILTAFLALIYLKIKNKLDYKKIFLMILIFIIITLGMNFYNSGYTGNRFFSILHDFQKLSQQRSGEVAKVGSYRIFIYQTSLPLLFKKPLTGTGLDTFAEVYPQEIYQNFTGNKNTILDKVHSEYLQLGITAGLPGLVLYLLLIGVIIFPLIKFSKTECYQVAILFSLTGYLSQAVFNISVVSVAPLFWIILGTGAAMLISIREERG